MWATTRQIQGFRSERRDTFSTGRFRRKFNLSGKNGHWELFQAMSFFLAVKFLRQRVTRQRKKKLGREQTGKPEEGKNSKGYIFFRQWPINHSESPGDKGIGLPRGLDASNSSEATSSWDFPRYNSSWSQRSWTLEFKAGRNFLFLRVATIFEIKCKEPFQRF